MHDTVDRFTLGPYMVLRENWCRLDLRTNVFPCISLLPDTTFVRQVVPCFAMNRRPRQILGCCPWVTSNSKPHRSCKRVVLHDQLRTAGVPGCCGYSRVESQITVQRRAARSSRGIVWMWGKVPRRERLKSPCCRFFRFLLDFKSAGLTASGLFKSPPVAFDGVGRDISIFIFKSVTARC